MGNLEDQGYSHPTHSKEKDWPLISSFEITSELLDYPA